MEKKEVVKSWDKVVGKVPGFETGKRYWVGNDGNIHTTNTADPNYAKYKEVKTAEKKERKSANAEKVRLRAEAKAANKEKRESRKKARTESKGLRTELSVVSKKYKEAVGKENLENAKVYKEQKDAIKAKIKALKA